MHPLIEKYGNQTISELIDMVIIKDKIEHDEMRMFLIRHGHIKQSTKIIKCGFHKDRVKTKYIPGSNGVWGHSVELPPEEQYDKYNVIARNGRNEWVFNATFTSKEIPQLLEEIQNNLS